MGKSKKPSRKDKRVANSTGDRTDESAALRDAETEVATVAAAVAAAAAEQKKSHDEEDQNAVKQEGTANIDWEALEANANEIPEPDAQEGEEEEEIGAQALLQLQGNASVKSKKKSKKEKKEKKNKKARKAEAEAAAASDPTYDTPSEAQNEEIAPELRDVDKQIAQLESKLDDEYVSPVEQEDVANASSAADFDGSKERKKRKRSNTTTSGNGTISAAAAAEMAAAANSNASFEDLQEFFHSGNPNWHRFYGETMGEDTAGQVDINMLIEEQAQLAQAQAKNKRAKRSSNVDPALEQLDEPNPLEMTTKEQSQLEDAMMHASAIVRTLASGGSAQHQFENESILPGGEKDPKKKRKGRDGPYDEDLINEAKKFAQQFNDDITFINHSATAPEDPSAQQFQSPASYHKKRGTKGDLAAISMAKDPAALNPRNRSLPVTPRRDDAANWKYVTLPPDADIDLMHRTTPNLSWGGDGSEHGGSFSDAEVIVINNFMMDYCRINNMSREELCQRVWSNERRKDNFWDDVAHILPNRTRASVYKHIRRAYHVFAARGKWTPAEDKELGDLVEAKGKQWKQIGVLMGRMPEDCRDRWRNYVKCGNKRIQNKWGVDEEERLRSVVTGLMASFPGQDINWTEVSDLMGGTRSRIQCRYKWTKLTKRAAMAKIDAMMPGDKISLLTFLKDSGYEEESQVDWDGFAALDPRGFWNGEELKQAFERLKSTLLDANSKPFQQTVNEILSDLLLLPEHRRIEKFSGETSTGVGTTNTDELMSVAAAASVASSSKRQVRKPAPPKVPGDLELTDDIIAVAAAAHAAMQESHDDTQSEPKNKVKKNSSSSSRAISTGNSNANPSSADPTASLSHTLHKSTPSTTAPSNSSPAATSAPVTGEKDKATTRKSDFYGIPPTASAFQQHRDQQNAKKNGKRSTPDWTPTWPN